MAQVCEVLSIIEDENLMANASRQGEKLIGFLMSLKHHKFIGDVRGRGLLLGVEIVGGQSFDESVTRF